jgi:16S rRNA (adenine1518-N6/adenine1519-N6)-dimethyltransferase
LTLALVQAAAHVYAVEIDEPLAVALPKTVAERIPESVNRLTVLHRDALRVTSTDFAQPPTALVANLPYNVAVPVVLELLAALPSLRTGLVLVQAEVADRLAAGPGSRTYGIPSVKAAWYADVRRAGAVSRSVFWPMPNVDSALVSFTRRAQPPSDVPRELVFSLVDAAFAQRRKTLRAALAGWAGSADAAGALLAEAGLPATARGEQLDVADFVRLASAAGIRHAGKG